MLSFVQSRKKIYPVLLKLEYYDLYSFWTDSISHCISICSWYLKKYSRSTKINYYFIYFSYFSYFLFLFYKNKRFFLVSIVYPEPETTTALDQRKSKTFKTPRFLIPKIWYERVHLDWKMEIAKISQLFEAQNFN